MVFVIAGLPCWRRAVGAAGAAAMDVASNATPRMRHWAYGRPARTTPGGTRGPGCDPARGRTWSTVADGDRLRRFRRGPLVAGRGARPPCRDGAVLAGRDRACSRWRA